MQLVKRIARILTADAHALLNALEDRQVLLRQHLREMEDVLNCQEAALGLTMASQEQLTKKRAVLEDDIASASRDAEFAVAARRDDVARLAIRRRQLLEAQLETTLRTLGELDGRIHEDRRQLRQRRVELEALQLQSRELPPGETSKADGAGAIRRLDAAVEMELMERKAALSSNASLVASSGPPRHLREV